MLWRDLPKDLLTDDVVTVFGESNLILKVLDNFDVQFKSDYPKALIKFHFG